MAEREPRGGEEFTARRALGTGGWCMFLVNVMAMFATASLLKDHLGGFWSFVAFLPIWAVFYQLIHVIESRGENPNDR